VPVFEKSEKLFVERRKNTMGDNLDHRGFSAYSVQGNKMCLPCPFLFVGHHNGEELVKCQLEYKTESAKLLGRKIYLSPDCKLKSVHWILDK
jgi:hypothetical protein